MIRKKYKKMKQIIMMIAVSRSKREYPNNERLPEIRIKVASHLAQNQRARNEKKVMEKEGSEKEER